MEIRFKGELYAVEGQYIPAISGRDYYSDGSGDPGEPADYEVESIVWMTCDENGRDVLVDVTDELATEPDFVDACITEYEDYYAD